MKVSLGVRIFGVINIIFMLLFAVVMLYPYLNQLAVSLNDGMDSALGGITIFPRVFTLENYKSVLINPKIPLAFFVSDEKIKFSEGFVKKCELLTGETQDFTEYNDGCINKYFDDTYIRTQLDNLHCGITSYCPHEERRGYTGW